MSPATFSPIPSTTAVPSGPLAASARMPPALRCAAPSRRSLGHLRQTGAGTRSRTASRTASPARSGSQPVAVGRDVAGTQQDADGHPGARAATPTRARAARAPRPGAPRRGPTGPGRPRRPTRGARRWSSRRARRRPGGPTGLPGSPARRAGRRVPSLLHVADVTARRPRWRYRWRWAATAVARRTRNVARVVRTATSTTARGVRARRSARTDVMRAAPRRSRVASWLRSAHE